VEGAAGVVVVVVVEVVVVVVEAEAEAGVVVEELAVVEVVAVEEGAQQQCPCYNGNCNCMAGLADTFCLMRSARRHPCSF
jgi:hypothetical protein